MKKLYLLRHAKSSWSHPDLSDFERPLNQRGRRDAPLMASRLKKMKLAPDLIISSPATRAAVTALIVGDTLLDITAGLHYHLEVYEASASSLINLIRRTPEVVRRLMLVGHNPGLTTLANYLSERTVDNIPTCGVFGLEFDISSWSELNEKNGRFLFFEYPKKTT